MLCCEHMLLVILMVKTLLQRFMKKNCTKQIQKSSELTKLREKMIDYVSNRKATKIPLTVGLVKKI